MAKPQIAQLTEAFGPFLDAFERLDTFVLHVCMNNNEEDAVDSKTVLHLREVIEDVVAKRAYLQADDLARMFHLFTQALK